MNLIFDLDLTLIDSKIAEPYRRGSTWQKAYSLIPSFTEYKGMKAVFDYIHDRGFPYCIVTSSPSTYCNKVCSQWGFNPKYMVCFHDTKLKKPHPEPINLALSKLKAEPDQAISFGDKDSDIIASNAANVPSVACLWGAEDRVTLLSANPTYIVNNPIEIVAILKNLNT
ncbi:MAG: HAD family hydrolase [Chitinophagaceae bacterium]|nr:HAD family hydrolase [Chitinophagaceae bacterium]